MDPHYGTVFPKCFVEVLYPIIQIHITLELNVNKRHMYFVIGYLKLHQHGTSKLVLTFWRSIHYTEMACFLV